MMDLTASNLLLNPAINFENIESIENGLPLDNQGENAGFLSAIDSALSENLSIKDLELPVAGAELLETDGKVFAEITQVIPHEMPTSPLTTDEFTQLMEDTRQAIVQTDVETQAEITPVDTHETVIKVSDLKKEEKQDKHEIEKEEENEREMMVQYHAQIMQPVMPVENQAIDNIVESDPLISKKAKDFSEVVLEGKLKTNENNEKNTLLAKQETPDPISTQEQNILKMTDESESDPDKENIIDKSPVMSAEVEKIIPAMSMLQSNQSEMNAEKITIAEKNLPPLPVNQKFGEELTQQALWMIKGDIQKAEIALDPPELGPIQIKITLQNDEAKIELQSGLMEIRDLLTDSTSRLKEMLHAEGFHSVNVDVSDGSPSKNSQNTDAHPAKDNRLVEEEKAIPLDLTPLVVRNKGIDLFA